MARPVSIWTPEAVLRLRGLMKTHSNTEIAAELGIGYFAVTAKRRQLRLLDSNFAGQDAEHRYARICSVPLAAVRSIGVEALEVMSEQERRRAIWKKARQMRVHRVQAANPIRMMELTERIYRLKRFQKRAA